MYASLGLGTNSWSLVRKLIRPALGLLLGAALTVPTFAVAQEQANAQTNESEESLELEEVVVTGVSTGQTKFRSSVSISTITAEEIIATAPRSTAEVLRSVSGVRSESSAGDGNTNVSTRGIPIAAGGGKFVQMQEDGMPVMQYGDIILATPDQFLRIDSTLKSVDVVKGSAAAAYASNAPGGIINFISNTGEQEGGSVTVSAGLDFDSFRTDFEYGGDLTDTVRFHVGGFYRQGEGPRETEFTALQGGQIKANITKTLGDDRGYVRLYLKHLDDNAPTYLPMPVRAGGNPKDPRIGDVPGFDATSGSNIPRELTNMLFLDVNGNPRQSSMTEGNSSKGDSVGLELVYDINDTITVREKFRWNSLSGRFSGAFTAAVLPATSFATASAGLPSGVTSVGYVGAAPLSAAQLAGLNGNGLIQNIRAFDADIPDVSNITNDLSVTKKLDSGELTFGYYRGYQEINVLWYWQTFLADVANDTRLLDAYVGPTRVTNRGLVRHGAPDWGNCCFRNYDLRNDLQAGYINGSFNVGDVANIDATVRLDDGRAYGSFARNVAVNTDVNRSGTIDPWEIGANNIAAAPVQSVSWDYNYVSWSLGGNWRVLDDLALYARIGEGSRVNADRIEDGGYLIPDGRGGFTAAEASIENAVEQYELGAKWKGSNFELFGTLFVVKTEDTNGEPTAGPGLAQRAREYESKGLEVEGQYFNGPFTIRGTLTYTDAEITAASDASVVGKTPRRQAKVSGSLIPTLSFMDRYNAGLAIIGTSKAPINDANDFYLPAYVYVNLFGGVDITDSFRVSLNVNNVFDEIGLTEGEGSARGESQSLGVIRARSIAGRSIELGLTYKF